MSTISVAVTGLKETRKAVANVDKQVRFATALSCTRLAQSVQKMMLLRTRGLFHIRGSWLKAGGRFGIAYEQAQKSAPVIQSRVYSRAPWMEIHEPGGVKTPKGGKTIAVPIEGGPRKTISQRIPKARRPRAIIDAGAFILETKRGPVIFKRLKRKGKLAAWYGLERAVSIKARWGFREAGEKHVQRNWMRVFQGAISLALRTAK